MPTTSAGLYTTADAPAPTPVEQVQSAPHIDLTSSGQTLLTKEEIRCLLDEKLDEIKIWKDRGYDTIDVLELKLDRAKFFINMMRQTKA